MEFTANRNDLARILGRAASAAAAKSPIAALCCVLLDASGDTVTARATDTMVGVECRSVAAVKKPGSVAIADAKRAFAVVKGLPAGDVTVKLVKGNVEMSSKKARFKLDCIQAEDFPNLPSLGGAPLSQVPARELSRLISQGAYALATSEERPHLNGALFDQDDGVLRCVSTDGHRLAQASADMVTGINKMLLAPRALSEVMRACESVGDGDIGVAHVGGSAFFVSGDFTLSVKCRDDVFPPYKKLTITPLQTVIMRRSELSDAVKRVALMAKKDSGQVILAFSDGSLRISTLDGSGEDSIDCACAFEFQNSVNHEYFAQAINVMSDDEIKLNLATPLDPVLVTPVTSNECSGLVMPMRK